MNHIRIAIAEDGRASRLIAPFMPYNYSVIGRTLDNNGTIIVGRDDTDSTLDHILKDLVKNEIDVVEIYCTVPTREQVLADELEKLETIACELIQDAQGEAEEAVGLEIVDFDGIVPPEEAAPDLDDARGLIRDAIEILKRNGDNA